MCPRSTQISPCYVGSHIVHICALILPTVPLSLSPSTGDLVSNWAVLVGWPSPIKDAHFTYHRSLWLAGSHPLHSQLSELNPLCLSLSLSLPPPTLSIPLLLLP